MDLTEYLENIQLKLQGNFDLERDYIINEFEYDLYARYNLRNERYIFTKKAKIYAIENNEYSLIKFYDDLNQCSIKEYTDALIRSIDKLINPNSDHMSSIITGVIVLNKMPNNEIIDMIKRFKYQKGFAFGFKGWVDIRLLLVSLNEEFIVSNKKGKEVCEVYSI